MLSSNIPEIGSMVLWIYGFSSHLPSRNPRPLSVKLQSNDVSPSEPCAAVVMRREDGAPHAQNCGAILVRRRTKYFIIFRGTILSFSITRSGQKKMRIGLAADPQQENVPEYHSVSLIVHMVQSEATQQRKQQTSRAPGKRTV